jgi:16S rRNA processing protein RimM
MAEQAGEWIRVALVRRAWGRRGGLKIRVETDWPERRLAPGNRIRVDVPGELPRTATVRSLEGGERLELEGVDSIDAASALAGAELLARRDELEPPEDELWRLDLEGLTVLDVQGRRVGTVEAVDDGVASDLLRVRLVEGGEALVPLAPAICREIDPERGQVVIDPPEGLLDPQRAETVRPRGKTR